MAEKTFKAVSGPVSAPDVTADHDSAEVFDKLRVGRLGVYFRDGFKTRFIPYADMERAFIRVHEVNGRLCCGSATFQYFRMVFMHDGREYADLISEKERAMDDALALIHQRAPQVAIGVPGSPERA